MSKVRIIIKHTYQPPIDTPARITHKTVVVESEDLYKALESEGLDFAQVIGAEIMEETDG